LINVAITNFTGAALDQQLTAVDLRNARSTQLESDLLSTRGSAGLMPSEAVFGAGGLAGGLGGNPLDSLHMGPEIDGLDDLSEALEDMQDQSPHLGAMQQFFGS
jgi:hypothetical protein